MNAKRARYIGRLTLIASLVVAALWIKTVVKPREALPTYGGKTVQEWFFGAQGHPGHQKTMEAAQVAFDAMGTNCVPYLVDKLRTRDTPIKKLYFWIYPRLPSNLQARFKQPFDASYVQMIALYHLSHLVPRLDYMANDLMAMVAGISDDSARRQAYQTVEILAVRLKDVEKKKAYFLKCLGDRDFQIQFASAVMLSRIDSSLTNGVAILVNAVTNKSLMNSTFPTTFPMRALKAQSQIMIRQSQAYEALIKVAPLLADQYRVAE